MLKRPRGRRVGDPFAHCLHDVVMEISTISIWLVLLPTSYIFCTATHPLVYVIIEQRLMPEC